MSEPYLILVKYTTRGRPERFFDGMDSIYSNCVRPEYLRVLITCDTDDLSMNNQSVVDKISEYKNAHVIFGTSTGKINAINRDLDIMPDDFKGYDILANFSDDQRFTSYGWDESVRGDFSQLDLSYYVAYLDHDTQGALSTLLIAGKDWVNMFGWIYDPIFLSLFADNLVEDCAKYLGKYHYTGYSIYQHLLPSYGHLPEDKMFREQQDIGWTVDQATYNEIIKKGIPEYLKQFNL